MSKKVTTEDFVKKGKEVHNNKYSYPRTVYTRAKDKLIITCPIHGDFTQIAYSHTINKAGCSKCGREV